VLAAAGPSAQGAALEKGLGYGSALLSQEPVGVTVQGRGGV